MLWRTATAWGSSNGWPACCSARQVAGATPGSSRARPWTSDPRWVLGVRRHDVRVHDRAVTDGLGAGVVLVGAVGLQRGQVDGQGVAVRAGDGDSVVLRRGDVAVLELGVSLGAVH